MVMMCLYHCEKPLAYRHPSFTRPHKHRRLLQALRQSGGVWPPEHETLHATPSSQWLLPFTVCHDLESLREYAQLSTDAKVELTFAHKRFSSSALDALRSTQELERVRALDLESCGLDDHSIAALLTSPHLNNLTCLSLRHNTIGPRTREAIYAASFTLTELDVSGCDYLAPLTLFSWMHLPGLKTLHMARCGLGNDQAVEMPSGQRLSTLETLILDDNPLGTQGCTALSYCEDLRHLKVLSLKRTQMSNASIRVLANTPHLLNLRALYADHNRLHDEGVSRLIERGFEHLAHLNLSFNQLGNGTLQALELTPNVPALKRLHLRHNMITDRGALCMTRSPVLPQLDLLDLAGNAISQKTRALLIAARPQSARYSF